jgi:hypothetical protein
MRSLVILIVVTLCNSCSVVELVNWRQSIKSEELRIEYPKGRLRTPEGFAMPPKCGHLYNVGRFDEWAECMGVGKK